MTDWTSRAPRPALSQEKATLLDGHVLQHWIPWEKPSYPTVNWCCCQNKGDWRSIDDLHTSSSGIP